MDSTQADEAAVSLTGTPDEALVMRIRAGEPLLFELLMRRLNGRVYRAIRSILRNEDEVEDAMQQAYVNAYAHLAQFNGASRFSTWLLRIAIHEALARKRKNARVVPLTPEIEAMRDAASRRADDPETTAMNHELKHLLEAAVDALPDTYRTVYVLRLTEGLDTAETAACLEISEDLVKQRLHRAKAALREKLTERLDEASRDAFPFHAPRCDRVVNGVLQRLGLG